MLLAAILIELLGIATIATGIVMEITHGGPVYLIMITSGSCLVATGGVIFGKLLRRR